MSVAKRSAEAKTVKGRSKPAKGDPGIVPVSGGVVDFDDLDAGTIGELMLDWVARGGLAMLYCSKDGGAVCIKLRHDDMRDSALWFHSEREMQDHAESYGNSRASGKLPARWAGSDEG